MTLVLVLIGLGSAGWGLAGNGGISAVVTGVLSLIMGLGFLIFAYTARRSAASEGQPGGIEYQITKIEEELKGTSESLGLSSLDPARLRTVEEEIETENGRWNDLKNLEKTHQDAARASAQRKEDLERTSAALSESEDLRTEAEGGWKKWLTERGLTDTMSGESVLELFSKVETARIRVTSLRELQNRVSAIQDDIDEIRDLVAPLAQQHGVEFDSEGPSTLIPAINELSYLLESAQGEAKARELDETTLVEYKIGSNMKPVPWRMRKMS